MTESELPDHYTALEIEPIDAIRSWLGDEGFAYYCRGNVIRYMARLGRKDASSTEARKAARYALWLAETLEGQPLTKT